MDRKTITLTVVANMTSNYSENLGNIGSVQKVYRRAFIRFKIFKQIIGKREIHIRKIRQTKQYFRKSVMIVKDQGTHQEIRYFLLDDPQGRKDCFHTGECNRRDQ